MFLIDIVQECFRIMRTAVIIVLFNTYVSLNYGIISVC